jgi:hypothetical protein
MTLLYHTGLWWLGGLAYPDPTRGVSNRLVGVVTWSLDHCSLAAQPKNVKFCKIFYKNQGLPCQIFDQTCDIPSFPIDTYRYKTPRPIDTYMYKNSKKIDILNVALQHKNK